MAYYNMGGIPHVVFDGVVDLVGAGADYVNGEAYAAVIEDRLLATSPLFLSVVDYSFLPPDPHVTVRIQLFADLPSIAQTYLRVGLCENGLSYGGDDYHNVLRDMLVDTPLTISQNGEVQEVTLPLVVNPAWDPTELWLFALVQRDSDQAILNAANSNVGAYALRVGVDGPRQVVLEGPTTFGDVVMMNVGIETDTFDITLDQSNLPAGWSAYFTMDGVDYTNTTITLEQFETAMATVTMVPGDDAGSGRAALNIHSHSGQMEDVVIEFAGLVGGANLLIVADDGGAGYAEDFYVPAINAAGKTHAIWDRGFSGIDAGTMATFDAVVWFCGDANPGLHDEDRLAIEEYLDMGGRLFLTGQDIARDLFYNGFGSWMINTLRTWFVLSASSGPTVTGEAGDPISDGIDLNLIGGDGAGNYYSPDVVRPQGAGSTKIFNYTGTSNGCGNRVDYGVDYGNARLVFLTFGFESINSAPDT